MKSYKPASSWHSYLGNLNACLGGMEITDHDGQAYSQDEGLLCWHDYIARLRQQGNELFIGGNGASAAMSSHCAADLSKNAGVRARTFFDGALLTAIANDICYERIFAEPILVTARKGDIFLAISSSGNSPNVIEGILAARSKSLLTITLTAMNPDNRARALGDFNIWVPAKTYGLAESAHAAILHYLTDLLIASLALEISG